MTVRIIKANTVQIMDYYPFGLMWKKQDVTSTDNLKWHHGKELQENEFAQQGKSLDLEDFGARMYDPILGRWWSADPLAEQRNWLSPYNFVQNNPALLVDPTGALDSPIYGTNGEFLGTDDQGLKGKPIIMKEQDFVQGMTHSDAEKLDLAPLGGIQYLEAIPNADDYTKFYFHYATLPTRPDYDGYITKSEADKWYMRGTGEALYVDRSKISLDGITTKDFNNEQNARIQHNFIWSLSNTGKVYGTLTLTLTDPGNGGVAIGIGGLVDRYDFTMDGRILRDTATLIGSPGPKGSGRPFEIFGYGRPRKIPVEK